MKIIPSAILVRVSTIKQETDRQVSELRAAAQANGWTVIETCEETMSGRAEESERSGIQRVLALAEEGKIRKVLVHEVSRVARKNSIVHRFVERLEECGVSLYWHAQRIETLLPSGKRNPAAGIMLALLAEMARNEVETLRDRINSGLAEARRKGTTLGRPKGTTLNPIELLTKHRDVVKLLGGGQSVRHAAAITGKGVSTVKRVAAALKSSTRSVKP